MKVERSETGGVVVFSLAGNEPVEIDTANHEEFRAGFKAALEQADRRVVLDLSRVRFLDSAGMGSLLALRKLLAQQQGELVLAGMNRSVREIFSMVGFDVIFRTYAQLDQAVSSFQS